jgi:hypothetical protein
MPQAATKPGTTAHQPRRYGTMSYSRLAANTVPIARAASDEAAGAGRLQVLLLMGSGVVAAAEIGKAVISVPMIRSDRECDHVDLC